MSAQDFLVELGTEELPQGPQYPGRCIPGRYRKGLQTAGLKFEAKSLRRAARLAVLLTALETQQPDRSINLTAHRVRRLSTPKATRPRPRLALPRSVA